MDTTEAPCAWMGDLQSFLATPEEEILRRLTRFTLQTGAPQLLAWDRTLGALRAEFAGCMPGAADFALILEFELPRSGGRRPDLIILENGTVLVVEFKNRVVAEAADLDQVLGYVYNLHDYHAACQEKELIPVLVPIGWTGDDEVQKGVHVVSPKGLARLVRSLSPRPRPHRADPAAWVGAPYEPLPALVEAARLLFERQPLPRIRQAESARIPETVSLIEAELAAAIREGRKVLVLLTGVPGSGKTLVGLQVAHSRHVDTPALFLSGNGPLVQVLKYSLGSDVFVQDMRSFLKEHLIRRPSAPRERILVFDEAQRAWDRDRVMLKHQGALAGSEPELLARIAARVEGGFGLLAVMGEGQEIHAGEEAGIAQWAEAFRAEDGWAVFGPSHLESEFRARGLAYVSHPLLNLTTTLRSHRAGDVSRWVEVLLAGRIDEAAGLAGGLRRDGFAIYASRSLEVLKDYARSKYERDPEKRYGLIASSKFRKLEPWGIEPARHNFWYYGPWFTSPPTHPRSCCRLELAISEFGCQGLELDLPILCWGPDLVWDGAAWRARTGKARLVRDPQRIRVNAYRVLLTRGRDGVLIFVPPEPKEEMAAVFETLRRAGAEAMGAM